MPLLASSRERAGQTEAQNMPFIICTISSRTYAVQQQHQQVNETYLPEGRRYPPPYGGVYSSYQLGILVAMHATESNLCS